MPRSDSMLRCFMLLTAIAALLTQSAGCAAGSGHAPSSMFGATCSPASHVSSEMIASGSHDESADGRDFAFTPLFTSTAAADHDMTHHALAIAFIDAQPRERFDFMPLFTSTAAPGLRPARRAVPFDLIADAD